MNLLNNKENNLESSPLHSKSSFSAIPQSTHKPYHDSMSQEFQTLKQINRILDSSPQSQEGKDQKIRSLIVMLKAQMDANKKLEHQISDLNQKLEDHDKQSVIRNFQVKNYQNTIVELKQKIYNLENQNKKTQKRVSEQTQELLLREDLIEKMKQAYQNQKYSMENQLHYLKQKTLDHFKQKLSFQLQPQTCTQKSANSKQKSCPRTKQDRATHSKDKTEKKSLSKNKNKNIIRRNILAISKTENELSGQNLLKKFESNKQITQRMNEIKKGIYQSTIDRF